MAFCRDQLSYTLLTWWRETFVFESNEREIILRFHPCILDVQATSEVSFIVFNFSEFVCRNYPLLIVSVNLIEN